MFRRIYIRAGSANFYTHNRLSVFPKHTRQTLPFQSVAVLPISLQGWGLIDLSLRASFSPAHLLADMFHPPCPPIASQSISRDVPLARARALWLFTFSIGGRQTVLHCAHRASTFLLRALRAQRMVACPRTPLVCLCF